MGICPSRCSVSWPIRWANLWRKFMEFPRFIRSSAFVRRVNTKSAFAYEKLQEKLHISGGECTEDGKFSLDACRCIGACGLAPVMTINDDVYGRLTGDELDEILAKY